jgi:4-hydroxy-tetrahydrodipicolinate synthase
MPRNEKLPEGLWPVMLTPFKDNNDIDIGGLQHLTEFYIDAGANGLFANCLSSEMFQLTGAERLAVTQTVIRQANGRIPVVATGSFGNDMQATVTFIRQIADTGAAAVILITSILAGPQEDDGILKKRLEEILEKTGDLPLGIYECPVPYKRLVTPAMLKWLSTSGRLFYHKDTSCDSLSIEKKVNALKGTNFNLYNADTPTALDSLLFGASGISPIAGNFYPELYRFLLNDYYRTGLSGELHEFHALLTIMDRVVHSFYPYSAKLFLKKRGLNITTQTRIPIDTMNAADQIRFASLYRVFNDLAEDRQIDLVL